MYLSRSSVTQLRGYETPFSAYDSDALRLLSAALSGPLDTLRKSKGGALTETETSDFSKKLTAQARRASRSLHLGAND
jgi:hypothetical protein